MKITYMKITYLVVSAVILIAPLCLAAENKALSASAQAEIELEMNRAREELRGQVAALALSGAEKVLGSAIDQQAHAQLVDQLASEL